MRLSSEEADELRRGGEVLGAPPDAALAMMEVNGPVTGRMQMSLADLATLATPHFKLTSREIDFFMSLIMLDNMCLVNHEDCQRSVAGGKPPVVMCTTPFFYSRLVDSLGNNFKRGELMQWFPNDIFLKTDLFLFPVNDKQREHWVLVAVDLRGKTAEFYDSAKLSDDCNEFARSTLEQIMLFVEAKGVSCGSTTDWSSFELVPSVPRIAQQADDIQCGVFLLAYASLLARGHRPPFIMMGVCLVKSMWDRIA